MQFLFRTLALGVLLTAWIPIAHAGNDEGIPIGVQATMTGGAVTASVSDGSAAWYNPAGLAHTDRTTLDLNVSIYGLDIRSTDALITTPDGTTADGQVTNWKLVPSAFAMVRQVTPTFNVALVVFIPTTLDFILQAKATDDSGDFIASAADIGSSSYYGLAMGWRLSPELRVGFAAFGTYLWTYRSGVLGANVLNQGAVAVSQILSDTRYGVRANMGIQWDVSSVLALGASVMSPSMVIVTNEVRSSVISGSRNGVSVYDSSATDEQLIEPYFMDPFKFRLGAHLTASDRWQFELDLSASTPIMPTDVSESSAERLEALSLKAPLERDFLWNASAGVLYQYSDKILVGLGIFTDFNPYVATGQDYMGSTLGFSYSEDYKLVGGSVITVESSLSARYAYGSGRGVALTPGVDPIARYVDNTTVHELSASIGSSVHF